MNKLLVLIIALSVLGWVVYDNKALMNRDVGDDNVVATTTVDIKKDLIVIDNVSKDAQGFGMAEAPRGGLGHWIKIKDGKVANYQAVVPSTWNAAPRDYKGRMGAYESSLIGTKVANVDQPLEILRTIHSFDPCIACAVHIVDTKGKELGVYKVDPIGGTSRA